VNAFALLSCGPCKPPTACFFLRRLHALPRFSFLSWRVLTRCEACSAFSTTSRKMTTTTTMMRPCRPTNQASSGAASTSIAPGFTVSPVGRNGTSRDHECPSPPCIDLSDSLFASVQTSIPFHHLIFLALSLRTVHLRTIRSL